MSNTRTEIPLDGSATNVMPGTSCLICDPYQAPYDSSYGYAADQWAQNPMPLNPSATAQPAPQQMMPVRPTQGVLPGDMPETLTNPVFLPGFLAQNIGKLMRVEFLIGNSTTDRVGKLIEVGASYILLQSLELGSTILCDLYSIKFATIVDSYYPGPLQP